MGPQEEGRKGYICFSGQNFKNSQLLRKDVLKCRTEHYLQYLLCDIFWYSIKGSHEVFSRFLLSIKFDEVLQCNSQNLSVWPSLEQNSFLDRKDNFKKLHSLLRQCIETHPIKYCVGKCCIFHSGPKFWKVVIDRLVCCKGRDRKRSSI